MIYFTYIVMCGQPKSVPNAELSGSGRYYPGAVVVYACTPHGYIFPEGGTRRSVVCMPDGGWSTQPIHGCQRKGLVKI